jgi:crotonobetainyl-CoA:carnitine CoA-transferase CaiB-like acyl-CoA transferase
LLGDAGVPTSQVRTIDEVFADPQVQALGLRRQFQHPQAGAVEYVPQPVHLSESPSAVRKPPPALGADSDRWLREAGYSDEDIEAMRADGAV